MAVKILVHGSGHKVASWDKTLSYMQDNGDIMCPSLVSILEGKEASYENLYASFADYCGRVDGQVHLCGLSLGGILALNYALDFPEKVKTLVLIGTPHKIIATQAMSKGKKSSMPVRLQIRAMPEITRNVISFLVPPISSKCSNFSINAFMEALRSIPYGVWVYNTIGGIGLSSGQKKKAVFFNCFS